MRHDKQVQVGHVQQGVVKKNPVIMYPLHGLHQYNDVLMQSVGVEFTCHVDSLLVLWHSIQHRHSTRCTIAVMQKNEDKEVPEKNVPEINF